MILPLKKNVKKRRKNFAKRVVSHRKRSKNKYQRNIFIFLILLAFVSVVGVFLYFLYKRSYVPLDIFVIDPSTTTVKNPVETFNTLKSTLGISKFWLPPCSFTDINNKICLPATTIDTGKIEFLNPNDGVYTFRWKDNIVGSVSKSAQDRYEIEFSKRIENIYGLGNDHVSGGVAIDDFQDNSFAQGNLSNRYYTELTNPDAIMARTPIFVIPEKNLIILYIQDEVKQLRLSRTASTTQIVMAKKKDYSQFNAGTFVLVTGNTLQDTYRNYYAYLNKAGYFFKKPHYKAFGLNWEIYQELGIFPENRKINEAIDQYGRKGLRLDTVTLGSGFWNYNYGNRALSPYWDTKVSCVQSPIPNNYTCGAPSMEILEKNNSALFDLGSLYTKLNSTDTYLVIGMRHNSRTEYASQFVQKMRAIDSSLNASNIFMNNSILFYYGYGMGDVSAILNTKNSSVMKAYIKGSDSALKVGNYGFRGLKEDEMIWYDQEKGRAWHNELKNQDLNNNPNHPVKNVTFSKVPNIAESQFADVYRYWDNYWNGDWVSMASTNYIGFGSDAQETNAGFYISNKDISTYGHNLTQKVLDAMGKDINLSKYILDKMLHRVMGGYPHPNMLRPYYNAIWAGNKFEKIGLEERPGAFCTITDIDRTTAYDVERDALMYLRDWQWATFTPVVWQSCGFWHLFDNGMAENYGSYSNHYEIADLFANRPLNSLKQPIFKDRALNTNLLKQYYDSAAWYGALRKRLQQYSYDMAQEWFQSGVPTLMRPLFVNEEWKNDPEVANLYKTCRHNETCYPQNGSIIPPEYMYGDALLVRPIMNTRDENDNSLSVYLPRGTWVSFLKPLPVINSLGGTSGKISFVPSAINHYPIFLREGRILMIGNESSFDNLEAYLYLNPDSVRSEIYKMHNQSFRREVNTFTRYQGQRISGKVYLVNLDNSKRVEMVADKYGKGFLTAPIKTIK